MTRFKERLLEEGFCAVAAGAIRPEHKALFGKSAVSLALCALPCAAAACAGAAGAAGEAVTGEIAPFARYNKYREAVEKLKKIAGIYRAAGAFAKSDFRIFCNSVLDEKALAGAYGLGALGRNGLIITREAGSLAVIAGIALPFALPDEDAETTRPLPDFAFCGGCPEDAPPCVRACPAGALRGDGRVRLSSCIQWYASGHGDEVPDKVRRVWGRRLYGCTACQDACVRNCGRNRGPCPPTKLRPSTESRPLTKLRPPTEARPSTEARPPTALRHLPRFIGVEKILAADDDGIKAFFKGSALKFSWLGPAALRRNAALCLAWAQAAQAAQAARADTAQTADTAQADTADTARGAARHRGLRYHEARSLCMAEQQKQKRASKLGPAVAEALKARYFDAYYFDGSAEALEKLWSLIPKSDSVSWGGSLTFAGLGGLERMVKEKGYTVIDRDSAGTPEERARLQHEAFNCGTFLTGCNAISEDGQLVNIDGMGNRVAAMIYGPRQVIVIAGMNKVVKTADDALRRARTVAAPLNALRFDTLKTPCAKTGTCADCKSPDSICTYIVTTRLSKPAGRIKVILIGKDLGL